ncbi:MAG: hypothetical protein K5894_10865, partial [Lachnospiraceae bacterium]|nr:hypothetical protein [Lachnospiraceae bacterium]
MKNKKFQEKDIKTVFLFGILFNIQFVLVPLFNEEFRVSQGINFLEILIPLIMIYTFTYFIFRTAFRFMIMILFSYCFLMAISAAGTYGIGWENTAGLFSVNMVFSQKTAYFHSTFIFLTAMIYALFLLFIETM